MICYPTLSSKGQVTIPVEIREELDLEPGERVQIDVKVLDVSAEVADAE